MKTNLNKFIIIIFFVFFAFFVIRVNFNLKEHMKINLFIDFPLKSEIKDILENSLYFKNFNKYDKKTRNLTNEDNIIKYYLERINTINSDSKKEIKSLIERIVYQLEDFNKKQFLTNNWNIIEFENLENNYPHTHLNSIFLPKILIKNIVNGDLSYNIKNTLIHEQVHVFQRNRPDLFHDLYTNYWNFKYYEFQGDIWNQLKSQSRSNPDTESLNWIFSNNGINIVILSLFNNNSTNISQVTNYGIYLDSDFKFKIPIKKKKLEDINEFTSFFGNILNNNYHPNEISAEIIASHCLANKTNIKLSVKNSQCYKKFIQWWNKIV